MSDERGALRARLEDGDWSALLDPLLPLILLEDPGRWWGAVWEYCSLVMIEAVGEMVSGDERAAALDAWRREVTPGQGTPRAWGRSLSWTRRGGPDILTASAGLLMIRRLIVVTQPECYLALLRQLVTRLPAPPTAAMTKAIDALAVLEQWTPRTDPSRLRSR